MIDAAVYAASLQEWTADPANPLAAIDEQDDGQTSRSDVAET